MARIIKVNRENLPKKSYVFGGNWRLEDLVNKCKELGLDHNTIYEFVADDRKYFAVCEIGDNPETTEDEFDF